MSMPNYEVYALRYAELARRAGENFMRHVIPGHNPLVMQRYPATRPAAAGVAVRLDADPVEQV